MPTSPATAAEIRELAAYLTAASGIELDESKQYLFEARLHKLVEEHSCLSLAGLLDKARRDASGRLQLALVDAVSTNETYFFREPSHFTLLTHKLIPEHFESRDPKRCRLWCAAVSTGQELYSTAITLKEMLGSLRNFDIQILGTDISNAALERASRGTYTPLEVSRGLSAERLQRFFGARGDQWAISDELRALATFRRLNLLERLPEIGSFDVVLCRNVAIYFSTTNRAKLFANIATRMRKGGYLLVSMTESLGPSPAPFVRREYRGIAYYELT